MVPFFKVLAEHGHLCLNPHRGQRCAQFMRRIGRKTAFVFQRIVDAKNQPVKRGHQGLHLARRRLIRQQTQVFRRTTENLVGQFIERLEPAPY